jgi:hypothetical protein
MLIMKADGIKPFEEQVLSSGLCDFALPADFVTIKGVRNAVFDSSGYTCLDDIKFRSTDNILELVEKSLSNLNKAGEYLIDPAHIVLDGRTVFQNLKRRDIKFAYVPSRKQRPMENVAALFDYFEKRSSLADGVVLRTISNYIRGRNLSLRDSARHVSYVRKELKTNS